MRLLIVIDSLLGLLFSVTGIGPLSSATIVVTIFSEIIPPSSSCVGMDKTAAGSTVIVYIFYMFVRVCIYMYEELCRWIFELDSNLMVLQCAYLWVQITLVGGGYYSIDQNSRFVCPFFSCFVCKIVLYGNVHRFSCHPFNYSFFDCILQLGSSWLYLCLNFS